MEEYKGNLHNFPYFCIYPAYFFRFPTYFFISLTYFFGRRVWNFSQSQGIHIGRKLDNFLSFRAYMGCQIGLYRKGGGGIFFHEYEKMWRKYERWRICRKMKVYEGNLHNSYIFLHISRIFLHIFRIFLHIFHIFLRIPEHIQEGELGGGNFANFEMKDRWK